MAISYRVLIYKESDELAATVYIERRKLKGALLSLDDFESNVDDLVEVSQGATYKKQKTSNSFWEHYRLFPSLPDEISVQILARMPRIYYLHARLVSRHWKATIMSPQLYRCRKELGTTEEWLYILTKTGCDKLMWLALDPIANKWQRLPPMPTISVDGEPRNLFDLWAWKLLGSSIRIADSIRGWIGKTNQLVDQEAFCGCAVGAVDGCLYVLGGFIRATALRSVWRYNPIINSWSEVSPMSTPRAFCKTGVLNGKLYVIGGLSRDHAGLTPLPSVEVFDPRMGLWSDVPSMPFSRAQMLPTVILSDLRKPVATGMTPYRGKLYVPQGLYSYPFFVDIGGEVYDPETNAWTEMPNGMGDGWPAKRSGTKLSAVVEGELYGLDPSSDRDSAGIKVYDGQNDTWKVIKGDIPIQNYSDSPLLLSGLLGKLHVITIDANHNILVMQANRETDSDPSPSISGIIAWRSIGSSELVSCQILDI